jgi:PAS domain S-box-containing protein
LLIGRLSAIVEGLESRLDQTAIACWGEEVSMANITQGAPASEPAFNPALVNAALRRVPDPIVWVDARGIVVLINDAARALFGRAFVGGHITQCVDEYGIQRPDGTPMQPEEIPLARALLRRERVVDEPCRVRRPNGRVVEVLATATPLDDELGRSVGAMLALREADGSPGSPSPSNGSADERRFQALVSATAQMVWSTDPSGVVTEDAPSWRAFTGQSWEEYRGYGWLDAVHEDDRERARRAWLGAVAARTAYEVEYRTRRHDGVYRWTVARGTPVLDREGEIVEWIGCNWDIDPIKRAERDLERVVEFQQMLLAIVGHDLRSPLSTITMGAAMLQTEGESPTVRRAAERMARAAMRASQLSGLLLDLAEVKLGHGLTLHREEVDVVGLAKDVIAEHESSVPGRAIVFTSSGETTAPVDPARVAQIFANLIGNAFHHGKPGTDIGVAVHGDEKTIEINVENVGDEIPQERREKLFSPFGGSTAPPSKRRNLGLGLYIVKLIAEAHGGGVDFESRGGRVVFRVWLRRARLDRAFSEERD